MNSTEYIEKNFALEKAENQNYLGVLYHVESDTIIKFIKSLPTVEAVPVSFLLKLQETAVNDEASEIINEIIVRWERERKEE